MRHAFVVMGPAGSGKTVTGTALADALGVRFVEGDTFHPSENVARMAAGVPLTDDDRHGWLLALAARLRTAREHGEGVVVSCSALKRSYRDMLRGGDDSIRFICLQGDETLLRARLESRRGHFMPASMLASQLAAFEPPDRDERAWTFDVRDTPGQIVAAITARLRADTLDSEA